MVFSTDLLPYFAMDSTDFATTIGKLNAKLSSLSPRISIELRGRTLSLRGTLPDKSNASLKRQQRISTGLVASEDNIWLVFDKAMRIQKELADGTFQWGQQAQVLRQEQEIAGRRKYKSIKPKGQSPRPNQTDSPSEQVNAMLRLCTSYRSMLDRCTNPNSSGWANYGGRGINVCERWVEPGHGLMNFVLDMGLKPEFSTIERVDNEKGYSPENCIWISSGSQQRNKRNTAFYEMDGQTLSLAQWCEEYDKNLLAVSNRLRRGWSFKKALLEPGIQGWGSYLEALARNRNSLTSNLCQKRSKAKKTVDGAA